MTKPENETHDLGGLKHDFSPTYNLNWPTRYLRAHLALDYSIPQGAAPVFESVIARCMAQRGKRQLKIIDLGCSYGINASLLNCRLSLDDLYTEARSSDGLLAKPGLARHRAYFHQRARQNRYPVVGIDPSEKATQYAQEVGLIDAAINTNLELADLSAADAKRLEGADLIVSTGCVGYVTEKSFARLYPAVMASRPWIACFVMHPFSYAEIARTLETFNIHTREIAELRQRQRRFSTHEEKRRILDDMRDGGMDDRYERSTGYIYAAFHLSVPNEVAFPDLM